MLQGWQGWWTGGIYLVKDKKKRGQFRWRTQSGKVIPSRPNFWGWGMLRSPYDDTCVWILQPIIYDNKWANYDCNTKAGFVCELSISSDTDAISEKQTMTHNDNNKSRSEEQVHIRTKTILYSADNSDTVYNNSSNT